MIKENATEQLGIIVSSMMVSNCFYLCILESIENYRKLWILKTRGDQHDQSKFIDALLFDPQFCVLTSDLGCILTLARRNVVSKTTFRFWL